MFFGKERPIKKKRRKRWFNFVLVGILEDVQYFKIQVQKLLLLLSSLHI